MSQLKRQLGLLDVFSIASGAMISSGLFVLPAIAFGKAGPAIIISYAIASLMVLPTVLSKAELATAMPKAGGTYFFIERSLGPMMGLFSGLTGWFSLALKSAFAIVGMAALIETSLNIVDITLLPTHTKMISVLCCLVFTAMNIVSVKHTGRLQSLLVAALLGILALFIIFGAGTMEPARFSNFFEKGHWKVLATAGLVFVSFGGLTKVASISEEVKRPDKNIPLGMLMAWFIVSLFYIGVIIITIGVTPPAELSENLAPISLAASKFLPRVGFGIMSLAALAAYITTANGGILAASRSPLAMSRDELLPAILSKVNKKFMTPHISIILTAIFMISAIVFLDIELLVKTASTVMIMLFLLENISVIVMRESKIQAYRPRFRCPCYPYIQIAAMIAYGILLIDMGVIPISICSGFFLLSIIWYLIFIRANVTRASAARHIVERVTDRQLQSVTLEDELRDILLERDEIIEDRFDKLIKDCEIIDFESHGSADELFRRVSGILAKKVDANDFVLFEKYLAREAETGTVIKPHFAIPHVVVEGQNKFDIVLVRSVGGVTFPHAPDPVHIMFFLAGSKDERNYHLRALMAIAQIAQQKHFEKQWMEARDANAIRNLILLSTRTRDHKSS